ncbi:hypothetical protein CU048_02860 [Beijerinckiaceae bacterium]|nr:hypothetical protein CU048_02860 [Beijerinckiaceae bacterium]
MTAVYRSALDTSSSPEQVFSKIIRWGLGDKSDTTKPLGEMSGGRLLMKLRDERLQGEGSLVEGMTGSHRFYGFRANYPQTSWRYLP